MVFSKMGDCEVSLSVSVIVISWPELFLRIIRNSGTIENLFKTLKKN